MWMLVMYPPSAPTVHALQEQTVFEHLSDRNQKTAVHETRLTDKKQQYKHDWPCS
jgi:hypothetical protein